MSLTDLRLADSELFTVRALVVRMNEKIAKLAMICAISSNPAHPVVSGEDVAWAVKFVTHVTKAMLHEAQFHLSEMNGDFSAEGFGDMTIFADPARRQACFDWYREQMFRKGPFSAGAWQTMHCSFCDLANQTLRICVKTNDEPFDFKL